MPDDEITAAIERRFHALVRARAGELIARQDVQLPSLRGERPTAERPSWFPIAGMYGGFRTWWEGSGADSKLIVESWSRVVGGSGQRHEITVDGTVLVEEGFV